MFNREAFERAPVKPRKRAIEGALGSLVKQAAAWVRPREMCSAARRCTAGSGGFGDDFLSDNRPPFSSDWIQLGPLRSVPVRYQLSTGTAQFTAIPLMFGHSPRHYAA